MTDITLAASQRGVSGIMMKPISWRVAGMTARPSIHLQHHHRHHYTNYHHHAHLQPCSAPLSSPQRRAATSCPPVMATLFMVSSSPRCNTTPGHEAAHCYVEVSREFRDSFQNIQIL